MAAPRHPVRVGLRFPVRVNMADTIAFGAIPEWMMLGWNLFQPDPIVGPEPVFSVASANYAESGNNIGLNPRVDAGKGLWIGPQVANLLPSGKEDITSWSKINSIVTINEDGSFRHTSSGTSRTELYVNVNALSNGSQYTFSRQVKKGTCNYCTLGLFGFADVYFDLENLNYNIVGSGCLAARIVPKKDGYVEISATWTWGSGTTYRVFMALASSLSSQTVATGVYLDVKLPQLTQSAYPLPYVPPGCTQPHNYATTGGNGTTIPLDAGLTAAYSGQNSFLDRIYFGFSSAQVSVDTALRSVRNATTDVLYVSSGGVIKSSDGTNTATVTIAGGWSADQIISLYRRTNGTQMQVGYRKSGETAITWGALVAYDGSDNPGTHERCCLNGTLPIWGQAKGTANKYCADSELLEMEALAA